MTNSLEDESVVSDCDAATVRNFAMRKRLMPCEHLTDKELYIKLKPRLDALVDPVTLMWRGGKTNLHPLMGIATEKGRADFEAGLRSNQHATYLATHIVMLLDGNYPTADGQSASHLCHESLCMNPRHLVWESRRQNLARNACIHAGRCLSVEEYATRGEQQKLAALREGRKHHPPRNTKKDPCNPPCLVGVHGHRLFRDGRKTAEAARKRRFDETE